MTNFDALKAAMVADSSPKPEEKKDRSSPPSPQEVLPSDRIAFDKQLKILLAYAAASDQGQKTVTIEQVAGLVEMNASTVSLVNNFFAKIGFLSRVGREFMPAREVLEYKLAEDWDPETAAYKLAPLVDRSWFVQAIKAKLQMRPVEEPEAIADLAQRAMVSTDYRPQLRMLISYMTATGLVRRDGDRLLWVRRAAVSQESTEPMAERPKESERPPSPPPPATRDGINLNVNVSVSMAEMQTWPADRIAAFFAGVAKVLAAKGGGNTD